MLRLSSSCASSRASSYLLQHVKFGPRLAARTVRGLLWRLANLARNTQPPLPLLVLRGRLVGGLAHGPQLLEEHRLLLRELLDLVCLLLYLSAQRRHLR